MCLREDIFLVWVPVANSSRLLSTGDELNPPHHIQSKILISQYFYIIQHTSPTCYTKHNSQIGYKTKFPFKSWNLILSHDDEPVKDPLHPKRNSVNSFGGGGGGSVTRGRLYPYVRIRPGSVVNTSLRGHILSPLQISV